MCPLQQYPQPHPFFPIFILFFLSLLLRKALDEFDGYSGLFRWRIQVLYLQREKGSKALYFLRYDLCLLVLSFLGDDLVLN